MTELDIAPKTPELAATPEIVYGSYETVKLPARSYVKMSQVRSERNRVTNELKDSLLNSGLGLISQLHVARMTPDGLAEYVDFVNHVWNSNTNFEQFTYQQQSDGFFYLIIDGHSRHQAIEELEEEGKIPPAIIVSNVHNVNSPEEIIQLQMHANIHSQPPRERRAIAIVESYEWGLATGRWTSQSDYIKKHHNVSATVLSEALAFSNLPKEVRDYVFANRIPYAAGVALGAAAPDFRNDIIRKTNLTSDVTPEQTEVLEKTVKTLLMVEVQRILEAKLNSTAAEKRIRSIREQMRRKLEAADNAHDDSQSHEQGALFELGLKSSEELLAEELASSKQALVSYLRHYSRTPSSAAADLIELASPLVDPDTAREIYADFTYNLDRARRHIGSRSTLAAVIGVPNNEQGSSDDQTELDIMALESELELAQ